MFLIPAKVVEHVSNVLESLENWHVENVSHVRFRLLSESPIVGGAVVASFLGLSLDLDYRKSVDQEGAGTLREAS